MTSYDLIHQRLECSPPPHKRARYDIPQELPQWSLKHDLVLHKDIDHGVEKLECESDIEDVDDTIFVENHPDCIDVSCQSMTPDTRLKQIAILDSALNNQKLTLEEWDNVVTKRMCLESENKINYFERLSDEVVLNIFHWIPKSLLCNVALVCRRFNRLTQDESLWTRMDVSNRKLPPGCLGKILGNQVIILRLARSEICYPPFTLHQPVSQPDFRSRLLFLDLSMAHISPASLTELFNKCKRLKKLSLENVPVTNDVLVALSGNRDIEVINLTMSTGIREEGLKYLLTNCRKIRELNISWTYINSSSIEYLCKNLPYTLDRLNFAGCRKLITDENVASLVMSCPNLRELDLSDCTSLTGDAVIQISNLEELNFLALSRCYAIGYRSLMVLRKMVSLSYLDIHGGFVGEDELKVLQDSLGARVNINKFKFSSVARPTVGLRRSSIWNMKLRD